MATYDPNLIWCALGDSPNPIKGNCGPADNDWCNTQLVSANGVVLVDNPDPIRGPPKLFKYTVNYYDGQFTNQAGVTYSDQRACTSTPGRVKAYAKMEWWMRFFMLVDNSWIGRFPKQDQQADWVNDPVNGIALDGGSGCQLHHGYDDNRIEGGSAPLYTGIDDKGPWLKLVDGATSTEKKRWTVRPLQRLHAYEWLVHLVHDTDPKNGLVELWIDDVPIVTGYRTDTMYPGTFNYFITCLYRRWSIGAPTYQDGTPLVWQFDAKPGVKYPALFTPKKGQRIYDSTGMTQSHFIGGIAIGKTRDAVVNLYPTIRAGGTTVQVPTAPVPAPSTPTPGGTVATTTPAAPEWLWKGVQGDLEKQLAQAEEAVTKAQAHRDSIKATLDTLVKKLQSGPNWLNP